MCTSGPTALPKAVPLTHRGLLWSCDAKRRAEQEALNLSLAAHEGSLAFLPSFHVIGFTNNFLCNLRHGTRCLLHHDAPTTPTSAPLLLRAATELRPSLIDTVPVLLEAMLPLDADTIATLRACKAVMYGGAPLSHAAWIEMRKNGICVLSQYGQTELGGMALIGSGMAPYGGLAPVPGVTAALEPASEGTLVLTGVQSLTPGYWPLDRRRRAPRVRRPRGRRRARTRRARRGRRATCSGARAARWSSSTSSARARVTSSRPSGSATCAAPTSSSCTRRAR